MFFCGSHVKYLKKNHIFKKLGDNVLYQPSTLPNDPQKVSIGNNVRIASGVIFYEHDVINSVFANMDDGMTWRTHHSVIEILDNVFIGDIVLLLVMSELDPMRLSEQEVS